ncbi:unnamed protein product [Gongylonema pulchrum]|uniref:FLZ-type domain-containing protein n=1 Tax=Gongylonema pulchrum TaxID=637853 RepID=A0A183EEZ8_9BILA|nr:unnamed protein product [Gongylonema pulchrum]
MEEQDYFFFTETPVTVDLSLNSSKSSIESAQTGGSLFASFSDEDLDAERCYYCNGLLRLKRLENHPQYCSKKCRKLYKKNPTLGDEQVAHSLNASSRMPSVRSTEASPINKESPTMATAQNLTVISEPSSSGISNESQAQQRSPPTLTLKMVSPQQAEIIKSPRATTSASTNQAECSKTSISVSPAAGPAEKSPADFNSRAAKTWTVRFLCVLCCMTAV